MGKLCLPLGLILFTAIPAQALGAWYTIKQLQPGATDRGPHDRFKHFNGELSKRH